MLFVFPRVGTSSVSGSYSHENRHKGNVLWSNIDDDDEIKGDYSYLSGDVCCRNNENNIVPRLKASLYSA